MRMKTNVTTSLRRKRMAAGLTQEQLAKCVGLKQSNLSRIEHGRQQPTLRVALAIARALGTSAEELFGSNEATAEAA